MSPGRRNNLISIMQINVEGLSAAKREYLARLVRDQKIDVLLIQETHVTEDHFSRLKIDGLSTVNAVGHRRHGIASYVRQDLESQTTHMESGLFYTTMQVRDLIISNIYKPPSEVWTPSVLPVYPHPAIYAGDFNSHHVTWGYNNNNISGKQLVNWSTVHGLFLTYALKTVEHSTRPGGRETIQQIFALRPKMSMATL